MTRHIDADRLIRWIRERRSFWRENRTEDAQNCWARLNEDACFLAAIESMIEEGER